MRLPHASGEAVTFRWEGREVEGRRGDSIAAALYAAGHRVLARSRKFHRPRGLSGAFAAGVLARVDGRPNVRLDLEPVAPGADVRAQNVWPGLRLDLLAVARRLPRRWLRGGFEHPYLMRSGTRRFEWWERALAFGAGVADPPAPEATAEAPPGRRLEADLVVVGGGPAGRAAANRAAAAGEKVVLVARGRVPGRFARALGAAPPELAPEVALLPDTEAFALYRGGALVACAPQDGAGAAAVIAAGRVVLATGRRSCPPLVPGADLPGVLDLHAALALAHDHAVAPGRRVVVVGTGAQAGAAERLRALGVEVVATAPVSELRRVHGRRGVTGADLDRPVACDALVHAGPWRADPNLGFQAGAEGVLWLAEGTPAVPVETVGAAAEPDQPVALGAALSPEALVCPCMDATVAEVLELVAAGETDVEILKRRTSCGMGPCQGGPCWDLLAAVLAQATGAPAESFGRPSHRPPRRALTVAQAAGLHGLAGPPS